MHDAHFIEQSMHALWLSLDQAAAVAGCIPMVIESAADHEARILALAGAVSRLLAQAREQVEAVEASLKKAPEAPARMPHGSTGPVAVAVAMAA